MLNLATSGGWRTPQRWFDTTAFSAPAPFTFGNSWYDGSVVMNRTVGATICQRGSRCDTMSNVMTVVAGDDNHDRCWWGTSTPDYVAYHDTEWGFGVDDDHRLFEKLCLEGFQSGLSWLTILRKRDNFRSAFAGFEPDAVARFGERDVTRLLGDAGIVRHRGKIEAAIANELAGFGKMLEVLEPIGVRQRLRSIAEELVDLYSGIAATCSR